ncbi:hypothetical protein [Microlunatus parietis]|uniref:Uncharacterized protein n=1 Tax=Microlunatus parietis TaxID=682979 RepID=A0A7Y9LBH7_9ACTN|nr:hypothetical protein [Microlunatus parietis]NYE71732.1 hypothetical protein [Microlunatus parietis]
MTVVRIRVPHVDEAAPPEQHAAIGPELDRRCAAIASAAEPVPGMVGIRGISLTDHPGWTADTLAAEIIRTGTDRHDPERRLPFTEFYDNHGVELHIEPTMIKDGRLRAVRHDESSCGRMLRDFRVGPPVDRGGEPLRIDLITLYDLDRLVSVPVPYDGGYVDRLTSWRFGPDRAGAVIAVVILDRSAA